MLTRTSCKHCPGALAADSHKLKPHTIYLPDLGDEERNARLHTLVADFVRQVARMFESEPAKGKGS